MDPGGPFGGLVLLWVGSADRGRHRHRGTSASQSGGDRGARWQLAAHTARVDPDVSGEVGAPRVLLSGQSKAIAVERTVVDLTFAPNILSADPEDLTTTAYFSAEGREIHSVTSEFHAVHLSPAQAATMELTTSTRAIKQLRRIFAPDHRCIEVTGLVFHPHRLTFEVACYLREGRNSARARAAVSAIAADGTAAGGPRCVRATGGICRLTIAGALRASDGQTVSAGCRDRVVGDAGSTPGGEPVLLRLDDVLGVLRRLQASFQHPEPGQRRGGHECRS